MLNERPKEAIPLLQCKLADSEQFQENPNAP